MPSLALLAALAARDRDARADIALAPRPPRYTSPVREQRTLPLPLAPSSTFHYFGGKVISRVQVVVVLWGGSVSSTASSKMGAFYSALVASPYLDWLGEYDTVTAQAYDGMPGSNQHVYRGTYLSTVTISPSVKSSSVQDSDIAGELDAQIAAKALPAPTIDPEGGVDTLYMVYFPPGVVIYDGQGATSCNAASSSSFCGYHNTFQTTVGSKTVSVPYGVIPDMTSAGCSQGCGGGSVLEDYTIASSHELAEAITDAEIGLASGYSRPMAFYDTYYGEIGDVCENTSGSLDTIGGYTVQKSWSQRLGKCIAQDPSLPLCGSQRPCRPCTSADNGGACNGATPVCETSTSSAEQGQCVACTSSSSCKSATAPVCDGATDTCRGCKSDGECGSGKCDTGTGACVACLTSNDCTSSAQSICDPSTHSCRGCQGNADCSAPEVCDVQAGTCVGCQSNADCHNPNLPICDSASHTCVPDPSAGADGGTTTDDGGSGGGGADVDGGSHHGVEWSNNSSGCSASPGARGGAWEWIVVVLGLGLSRRRRAARR